VLNPGKEGTEMSDTRARIETCCIHTDRGTPTFLTLAERDHLVPLLDSPAESVAAALADLGYEPLGCWCWVNRGLSILTVRRRAEEC
jgi:hypothetical protein